MPYIGFQSQIRDSITQDLLSKVAKRKYGKYLLKIKMSKLRG